MITYDIYWWKLVKKSELDTNRCRNKCQKSLPWYSDLFVEIYKQISLNEVSSICQFVFAYPPCICLNLEMQAFQKVLSLGFKFLQTRETLAIAVSPGSEPLVVLYKGGKCPVKDNGQMMKVPAPAAAVPMRIREILRCQNQKNKRSENNPRLHNSRRNPPNCPAKQQPNYPPARRGKADTSIVFWFCQHI